MQGYGAGVIRRLLVTKRTVAALLAFTAFMALAALFWFCRHDLADLYEYLFHLFEKRERLREFVAGLGSWGPVGFVCIQILQIIFSPIPGEATGLLGGFLFGKWAGFLYSTIGLTAGSVLAFLISRQFRRLVLPWLKRSAMYGRFENLLEHQGLFICFFLFLMPGFPKDFLCYLLGLSRMPLAAFAIITGVGRIPGTLMLSFQGAEIYNGNTAGLIALLIITGAVALPAWYWRETVYGWVEAHTLKDD